MTAEIKQVTPMWIEYYQRDDETKMWNKVGDSQNQLGSWSTVNSIIEWQFPYSFLDKQKIRVNFLLNTPNTNEQKISKWMKINFG